MIQTLTFRGEVVADLHASSWRDWRCCSKVRFEITFASLHWQVVAASCLRLLLHNRACEAPSATLLALMFCRQHAYT